MILDFDTHQMTWDGKSVPMRVPPDYPVNRDGTSPIGMEIEKDSLEEHLWDNDGMHFVPDDPPECDSFANPNLTLSSNQYKAVEIDEWVELNCTHLDAPKRTALASILSKYPSLWDNKLGTYPDYQVHLDLKDGAIPHSSRGYPVPFAHRKLFKDELNRLVAIGVLEPCN